MPVAARHLAAVPGPATRKKVDSIIRVTLSRDFRVVWENSVGTDALVRPQRDSAAGKNSFGISIPASVGRDALVPPTINRTPLSFRAKRGNLVETKCRPLARASPLARGGSPSRNPPRKKREQVYTLCGGPRANRPTVGYAVNRTRLSLRAKRGNLVETKCRPLARAGSAPRQPTCPRWLTAEKSPAEETRTSVHVMRRSEGEPPYRRLRSESDTIVIASEAWQSHGNEMPPTRPRQPTCSRWLTAEKYPAEETRTSVHELPQILARGGSPPQKTIRSFLPRESFFYIRYSVFATRTAYFRLLRLYAFRIYCGLFSRPKSFSFAPETVYFRACDGGKPCRLL